ncbi:MAG: hypothetical protein V1743_03585 [Nanoarchaeota archaeon]
MLKLRCPRCKQDMLYDPKAGSITSKVKRCVYCGHSFKVHTSPEKSRIVQEIKKR